MAKITKKEIDIAFAALCDEAETKNRKQKGIKRFLPMRHERHGKLQEFGLYDYTTKRWTLANIHSGKAQKVLHEIKAMLETEA